jgi:hypothetical protein
VINASLLALALLAAPADTDPLRGTFDSVVPRLPGGYGPGPVSIRVHTVEIPASASPTLVGDLIARTGVAITETQGARIELVLPDDVTFDSMRARIVDGLALQPQNRSFIGRVGDVLVSLLRILLVGRLVSATDELSVSGAVWTAALGAPSTEDELVRLSTSDTLHFDRDSSTFSDHAGIVVCRTMLGLSPWTELVDIELRCTDRVSGESVGFVIPRLPLHRNARPEPNREANWQLVMAAVR